MALDTLRTLILLIIIIIRYLYGAQSFREANNRSDMSSPAQTLGS
jgi:hypothetical protein